MASPKLEDYIIVFEMLTANLPEAVNRTRHCRIDWEVEVKELPG
jgi:hypothetical protein